MKRVATATAQANQPQSDLVAGSLTVVLLRRRVWPLNDEEWRVKLLGQKADGRSRVVARREPERARETGKQDIDGHRGF